MLQAVEIATDEVMQFVEKYLPLSFFLTFCVWYRVDWIKSYFPEIRKISLLIPNKLFSAQPVTNKS